MSPILVVIAAILYVFLLFIIAYYSERRAEVGKSLTNNPYIYSLSLAVYCTAWTYYGSVGRAATSGIGFLPIYLGPTLMAPLFMLVLRKIIAISKEQRITSIADFISARYGKSTSLGIIVTLVLILGIVPYISIQLKAIAFSIQTLTNRSQLAFDHLAASPFYEDPALYVATALTFFTIIFGVRKLDPNERHEGLVAAIAFESIIKLAAFLTVGIFVTYGIFNGFGDIFGKAGELPQLSKLFTMEGAGLDGWTWLWLTFISMSAILFLPRQFHMAVVENDNVDFVRKASWILPLYLFLINIFVLPIAFGGSLIFGEQSGFEADTYVLRLPMEYGRTGIALLVFLGGLSAATGMVIVSVIALSIMSSNNLLLPAILGSAGLERPYPEDFSKRFLGVRRMSVVIILFLAYGYYKLVGVEYPLVSIGLISFTAVAQLIPAMVGSLYWKQATAKGVTTGLIVGFTVWAISLPIPTLAESGLIQGKFMEEGILGLSIFRPYAFFGYEGMSPIAHAAFWSLLLNTVSMVGVSLFASQNTIEIRQAELFVDIFRKNPLKKTSEMMVQAQTKELVQLLNRFLGEQKTNTLLKDYEKKHLVELKLKKDAPKSLIRYAETHLAGAMGAASAGVIIGSIIREEPVSPKEMMDLLEQTQEIMEYSRALEQKSSELEAAANKLRIANERLKELDRLKADFINTITHELRTPITSIKSFSKILLDNPDLPEEKKDTYLDIVVSECERLGRLINQVLDLRKLEAQKNTFEPKFIILNKVVNQAYVGLQQLFEEKHIGHQCELTDIPLEIKGDRDKLIQVFINLLSNAIKFCAPTNGEVKISLFQEEGYAVVSIWDNGEGISKDKQEYIFEKFTQLKHDKLGKPSGSGLGLFITKEIVEQHEGFIKLKSSTGEGTIFSVFLPLAKKNYLKFLKN